MKGPSVIAAAGTRSHGRKRAGPFDKIARAGELGPERAPACSRAGFGRECDRQSPG